jgi:hypothetical protein
LAQTRIADTSVGLNASTTAVVRALGVSPQVRAASE